MPEAFVASRKQGSFHDGQLQCIQHHVVVFSLFWRSLFKSLELVCNGVAAAMAKSFACLNYCFFQSDRGIFIPENWYSIGETDKSKIYLTSILGVNLLCHTIIQTWSVDVTYLHQKLIMGWNAFGPKAQVVWTDNTVEFQRQWKSHHRELVSRGGLQPTGWRNLGAMGKGWQERQLC